MSNTLRHQRQTLLDGHALPRRAHYPFAETDEGDDQQYLSRCHGGLHDLNRRQIQAEYQRDRGANEGRYPKDWNIADHDPQSHTESESIR